MTYEDYKKLSVEFGQKFGYCRDKKAEDVFEKLRNVSWSYENETDFIKARTEYDRVMTEAYGEKMSAEDFRRLLLVVMISNFEAFDYECSKNYLPEDNSVEETVVEFAKIVLNEAIESENPDVIQLASNAWGVLTDFFNDNVLSAINDELVEFIDKTDSKKDEFMFESACQALAAKDEGVSLLLNKINEAEVIDDKTIDYCVTVANCGVQSDEVYKTLRSATKKSSLEKLDVMYNLFRDYGDNRAVSFLRARAKIHQENTKEGNGTFEERKLLMEIVDVIEALGGHFDV